MMDSTDMTTPVTRGELQEVLSQVQQEHWRDLREATAPLATKAELHQEIQTAIAPLATKAELEMWGGALMARIQQGEQRLLTELARHTSAIHEAMRTEIKASFEPIADLPGRVSRLETEVFGPTPRDRRTRRRSH